MDPIQFAENHVLLLTVLAYAGTAAVNTMPPKDAEWSKRLLYAWLYDLVHMLLNSRNQLPILPAPVRTPATQP